MESQQIQINRAGAEIFTGESSICKQKSQDLLGKFNLPKNLLPLENVTEFGYNRTTNFIWLKQKAKMQHKFKALNRSVSYDAEVTAFIENKRMRQLTGCKTKEFMITASVSDIYVDEKDPSKINFATPMGITRSFPASAFALEDA
ncbi:hypothetical protein M5689_012895 [Euphorbia peplus]|nr:hypothetical protein M5689_012895 [Euphorbia peplus]